jgi:cytochrome P450
LRTLAQFRRDPIAYLRRLARDYGDIVRFRVPGSDLVLVNDPDRIRDILVTDQRNFVKGRGLQRAKRLLGEGLLTSEGDFHLRQRRMIAPAFHRQRINEYGQAMAEIADRASRRWHAGGILNINEEMAGITLTIVGKTLFDADVESEQSEIGQALRDSMELFNVLSLPFAELLSKLPLPAVKRFQRAKGRLDATIYRIIDERRNQSDRGDLLSMLLAAYDEEGGGDGMTDLQVRDEAMTLFLAGHETTANALGWTLYQLSDHPDVEAKVVEELRTVLGGRLPTLEDIPNLRYTRQVISESLRLYPPGWILGRRALADYPIGDYVIEKGSIAILAPVVIHIDPRYWTDPMRFDPDRWATEDASRPKFAYFPFGGGPRICIGENFAWMELVLILSTLLQRWQFRLTPDQKVETAPIITLRPRHPIRMEVRERLEL